MRNPILRSITALLPLAVAFAASAQTASPANASTTDDLVVTAAKLFDARSGKLVDRPQVLIRDGRIVEVGRVGDAAPDGIKRLDLAGMTLLPGLIDMHTHLDSDPTYGGYTGLQFNDRFWSVLAVKHAQQTLDAGFTTVRNVGADAWNDVGLRQAIDEGQLRGPRIVTAAYSFGATGGHCDSTFFPPSMNQKSPYNADSPEQARQRVRELRKYGAQVIKICATGGVFSR
ncbi:MAG: amidohydrolase family protein, partial [Lysobacter sp.]|nr:amidohydrolase family protein [Lysobacter sp.]